MFNLFKKIVPLEPTVDFQATIDSNTAFYVAKLKVAEDALAELKKQIEVDPIKDKAAIHWCALNWISIERQFYPDEGWTTVLGYTKEGYTEVQEWRLNVSHARHEELYKEFLVYRDIPVLGLKNESE